MTWYLDVIERYLKDIATLKQSLADLRLSGAADDDEAVLSKLRLIEQIEAVVATLRHAAT